MHGPGTPTSSPCSITDIPKLWTLARASIYPALRSRYTTTTLEIDGRNGGTPLPPLVQRRWLDDLILVLLYDFGQHMNYVPEALAEGWGAPLDEIWGYALHNLKTLPRPRWETVGTGVFRIVSEVAYEETFLLLDEVRARLKFSGHAVFALPNRGILLAADSRDAAAVRALIAEAHRQVQHAPWPLSGSLIERTRAGWQHCRLSGVLAADAHCLETVSLSYAYRDQKSALDKLHERTGIDLFVASFALRDSNENPEHVHSYCVWTEGVDSLLPKTDHLIFNRDAGGLHPVRLAVPWQTFERVCGHYLESTTETPARYRARRFPNEADWTAVKSAVTEG
ncbi:MAG TPA: hypothetical protein VGP20_08895 [Steroidobacteraceae bacterium]|jgi:hypothetical protein|nr:hypothetical protein [Steroidobacteraceae bacterium]